MLGTTIGNYKITAEIGHGGMGVVYLAEHPSLGRKAAVKVLHARLAAEPSVVSRFFHEARASNAIRHPNIVEAFDYGTLPDGNSYIVMEYLEGENLASRLSQVGRLPVRLALDFANQAAGALAAAHAKGIVHRDLKPDNLFVTPDPRAPSSELIKILDFGIAKLASFADGAISHKTHTGAMLGTPLYMSPEQCLGVKEVDRRTDIYSLGCILYEMLCGAPPFVSEGFGALVNMHINQPPEPPSKHSPQISPGVERLVLKMLAKNADERFQSMDAVREALGVEIARAPTYRPGDTAPPEERPRRYSSSATTLSEAAAVAAGTVPPRGGSRRALGVGAIAVAIVAVVAVAALRRGPSSTSAPAAPPPPPPVLSVTPAPAPAAPAVPAPAAAAATAPAAVEVVLDSNPEGALVSAEGVAIGTTPMKWQVAPTGNPRTLTFKLAGYRTEIMQANPAAGLRLRPTLERQAAHRSHSKPSLSPRPGSPVDDIKSER
ncbi:MAG TPA: serine/threonine-protein kinase [Polyangia bacterium]|nr:serine/threonine-protein kinase [Polyangia bacterium]